MHSKMLSYPKGRCAHSVLNPKKIDPWLTQLICESCGEVRGEWIKEGRSDVFITGPVTSLSEEDKESLK